MLDGLALSWDLLLLPAVTGLIGWGTNALAIRMIFSPLDRFGWGRLSWQGIIPANATRMANICVELMTERLLDVREVSRRLEPARVAALLGPTLERRATRVVEDVLSERHPTLWEATPNRIKDAARARLVEELPGLVQRLLDEVTDDIDRLLDLRALVVEAFERDRALLNELFWRCGGAEFRFIVRSGLMFGALFGLVQAAVWIFVQPWWLLPATGLLVGWATNWLALKMCFEPLEPREVGPWRWQGLFLKRQAEVSREYAAFFADRILRPEALTEAVLRGPASARLTETIRRQVTAAIDEASGPARPVAQLAVGTARWLAIKHAVTEGLVQAVPEIVPRAHDYVGEALGLEQELQRNLERLAPAEFEGVLRPVFREDETTLIAIGAALGGVAGVAQWLLVG